MLKIPCFICLLAAFSSDAVAQISPTAAARFLDQASWGASADSINSVVWTGTGAWLQNQFNTPAVSDLPDQNILSLQGNNNNDLRPVQAAFFQNTVQGTDQLRQRVAFALSQIWVVSDFDVNYAYAFPPYWRVFRDNAFGNYRDLIREVTLNPAMGRYLNMANNNKGNPAKGTSANENYGRELLQLFTLGLTQLNLNGTPVIGANGQPVPTYDAAAVTGVADALTGWTYPDTPGVTPRANNPQYFFGRMYAVQANHDTSEKHIFGGITIPAGQTAEQDLESVIDALMQQTTMAPFVSQQLIEHLVTSNPSAAYIQRVSSVFLNNGQGVRGDLKAVITAILMDPEARAGDNPSAPVDRNFGHLREPVLFISGVLRALNIGVSSFNTLYNDSSLESENLFYDPSVFSYFSPQFRIKGGLLGPEFQIYSTQTAKNRTDFVNNVVYHNLANLSPEDLTVLVDVGRLSPTGVSDYLSYLFLHNRMSAALRSAIASAVSPLTDPLQKAQAALYLVLTSGEYQIVQ